MWLRGYRASLALSEHHKEIKVKKVKEEQRLFCLSGFYLLHQLKKNEKNIKRTRPGFKYWLCHSQGLFPQIFSLHSIKCYRCRPTPLLRWIPVVGKHQGSIQDTHLFLQWAASLQSHCSQPWLRPGWYRAGWQLLGPKNIRSKETIYSTTK